MSIARPSETEIVIYSAALSNLVGSERFSVHRYRPASQTIVLAQMQYIVQGKAQKQTLLYQPVELQQISPVMPIYIYDASVGYPGKKPRALSLPKPTPSLATDITYAQKALCLS